MIFDNVGGKSIKKGKSVLAAGGRLFSLGAATLSGKKGFINLLRLGLGFGFFSPIPFLEGSQSLIGVNMLKIADHRLDIIEKCFQGVIDLYSQGIFKPHVGKVFEKDQLAEAHAYVEDRHAIGKVVVKGLE